jgi:hypothetical protein
MRCNKSPIPKCSVQPHLTAAFNNMPNMMSSSQGRCQSDIKLEMWQCGLVHIYIDALKETVDSFERTVQMDAQSSSMTGQHGLNCMRTT